MGNSSEYAAKRIAAVLSEREKNLIHLGLLLIKHSTNFKFNKNIFFFEKICHSISSHFKNHK